MKFEALLYPVGLLALVSVSFFSCQRDQESTYAKIDADVQRAVQSAGDKSMNLTPEQMNMITQFAGLALAAYLQASNDNQREAAQRRYFEEMEQRFLRGAEVRADAVNRIWLHDRYMLEFERLKAAQSR